MLEVELDIFSGVPNPTWRLSRSDEGALFELLRAEPKQISKVPDGRLGLGYRGLIVRQMKTDDGPWSKATSGTRPRLQVADTFRVGAAPATKESAAAWLLKTADRQVRGLPDAVREVVSRGVVSIPRLRGPQDPTATIDRTRVEKAEVAADVPYKPGVEEHETWWACGSNYFSANAAFFNDPAHVGLNNCYCFASNYRPDIRYARPGVHGGRPAAALTCASCIDGLRADGWQDGCQPNGLTIVMVMWPGHDYHFYRLVTGGPYWWWGHKPGGTPARYTDDCGHSIYQYQGKGYAPNNICRGSYTDFCGYFYQDNWTAFCA